MINRLRRILFQSSHLSPYIPILKQTPQQKICRLIKDSSNPKSQINQYSHFQGHRAGSILQKLVFGNLPILNPTQPYLLIWYCLVLVAILYNYVQFGIVLYYENAWEEQLNTPFILFFSIIMILILVADIGVQMNTGYLKRGMIITERKRVVRHYIRSYLLWDLAYLTILVICLAIGSLYLNYGKYLWVFKLIRMSEIDDYFLRSFNIYRGRKTIYVILKLIMIILILSHAVGVVFYILDYYFLMSGYYAQDECWLISSTSYSPIIELSWGWQYMYTLYWGINTITTISYGDIAPLNPLQTIYTTFIFCFGFVVYGYVVNQIVKVILWARGHKDQLRADMVVMDVYMDNLKVPSHTKNEVRNHLQFLYTEEKNRDIELEKSMRAKLPQDLRYQLVANAYSQMNFSIISIFQSRVATKFLFNLEEKKYTFDQNIVNQGERADFLHFLHKGLMNFTVTYGKKCFTIYQSQTENEFLGQYELFARKRLPFTITSKMASTIYSISRENMFNQINSIQQLREKFKQVEYEVIFKENFKRIYYKCYLCKENHSWNNCPQKFLVIRKVLQTEASKVNKSTRVIRRKYHTLNDRKQLETLKSLRHISNKRLVNTIQRRIAKIKEKITEKNQQMEIDIARDWKYFDVTENLSRKKEIWNERINNRYNEKMNEKIQRSKTTMLDKIRLRQNMTKSKH